MYLFLVYVCLVYIQRMEGLFWMDFRLTIYLWKIFERTRNNLFKNGELFELVNSLYLVILWRFLLLFDCSVGWVSVKWVIWWIWWEGNTLCIAFFFFLLLFFFIGSFYACWRWSMATIWLCYREHGWIKSPPTSYYGLSSVATHCCFSLYIHSGAFWSWIPCEF